MKGTIIRGAPLSIVLIRFGATSFMWCVPPPKCIYIWCACFAAAPSASCQSPGFQMQV
ncbi:hypothetical protein PF004_g27164 [Phytophthora fragariae]|uniref:RxLR effector protein n=1 Tax=Phytophthora fragariae TaxID=53985 RepID=A0A6G0MLC6_9STRA|nr:hypothetical protein PF004_g27164 [Phytophthora fragariae]